MNRRTFLKIAGMGSLSVAAGCNSRPEKNLFSLVHSPSDMITGKAAWYASTCRECPAGCGILAKNREGRVIKVEGNPFHPVNRGRLCMRGQAALQGVYNPDRIKTPLLREKHKWRTISFSMAEAILKQRAEEASKRGPGRVRMMTEVVGRSLTGLFKKSLDKWRSGPPLVFEPFGYESLKAANELVLGEKGPFSYRMEDSDFLVSFGADFLETWLSPVEYARKFKEMHAYEKGTKALFFHISPYQSLTCANADLWISCRPGTEDFIALGLVREALENGKGLGAEESALGVVQHVVSQYTRRKVLELSGVSPQDYDNLRAHLIGSRKPLVLGTGNGGTGGNALRTNVAVNLLNHILDPALTLFELENYYRVGSVSRRSEVPEFFHSLQEETVECLLLNNVNPVYALPPSSGVKTALGRKRLFVVSFSNFMDETTALADLILPAALPLEAWDMYEGSQGALSTMQPAMGSLTGAPSLGDIFLRTALRTEKPPTDFMGYLFAKLRGDGKVGDEHAWLETLRKGGIFEPLARTRTAPVKTAWKDVLKTLKTQPDVPTTGLMFMAYPSIRFLDGRGANRSWLCEIPDPLARTAWQTPILIHPETLNRNGLKQGDIIEIQSKWGTLKAPVYESEGIRDGVIAMALGQGHRAFGRYAKDTGLNPGDLLPAVTESLSGAPLWLAAPVAIKKTQSSMKLAHTDGSRFQEGRKIALSVTLKELGGGERTLKDGLSMEDFPLTLPLPEGYERKRDFYPPHEHDGYRWAMTVDLDRCIGCGACVAACYAENNIGVVGVERVIEGREMAWLSIERYHDPEDMKEIVFLPMLCQQCDNAPCEPVCPVFAPHHSKEGLNNQIYNRCIGTRFCSQNCPYKVRRFNWFDWKWPGPLHLQLNPDVTVRSKGVMEKCSFCIQRIKEAHGRAKDRERKILDGEIQPACLQTCPTKVFTFGNLMDPDSRVRKMAEDRRAYQVMGYLNTKPAVIYLRKVVQEI